jgi:hypothetical protein
MPCMSVETRHAGIGVSCLREHHLAVKQPVVLTLISE